MADKEQPRWFKKLVELQEGKEKNDFFSRLKRKSCFEIIEGVGMFVLLIFTTIVLPYLIANII